MTQEPEVNNNNNNTISSNLRLDDNTSVGVGSYTTRTLEYLVEEENGCSDMDMLPAPALNSSYLIRRIPVIFMAFFCLSGHLLLSYQDHAYREGQRDHQLSTKISLRPPHVYDRTEDAVTSVDSTLNTPVADSSSFLPEGNTTAENNQTNATTLLVDAAAATKDTTNRTDTVLAKPVLSIITYGDSLTWGQCSTPRTPYAVHLQAQLPSKIEVLSVGMPGFTTGKLLAVAQRTKPLAGLSAILQAAPQEEEEPNDKTNHVDSRRLGDYGMSTLKGAFLEQPPQAPVELCILMSGTNDLALRATADSIVSSLETLHELCHERGIPSIAIAIPPSKLQVKNQAMGRSREVVNERLQKLADGNEMMTFVPFPFEYDEDEDDVDANPTHWCADGLHFSNEGYRVLGEFLAPFVRTILHLH